MATSESTRMSAIESHGVVESQPSETYGSGETILRIGNGGAGATGLVAALANDYLSTLNHEASITWVCNHSRNTQLALQHDFIDIALTYEREQEQISIDEGWAVSGGCAFHDHFCLAGPVHDPAGVKHARDLLDAFKQIADKQAWFISRADYSATMIKERSLWKSASLTPWLDHSLWYIETLYSPAEALQAASSRQAYLLTDRSTLLHQTSKGAVHSMTVFFEPSTRDSILMNSCFVLYQPPSQSVNDERVRHFLDYVLSPRGQKVVGTYGQEEVGLPFFADVASGFATTSVVGGTPVSRLWIAVSST